MVKDNQLLLYDSINFYHFIKSFKKYFYQFYHLKLPNYFHDQLPSIIIITITKRE